MKSGTVLALFSVVSSSPELKHIVDAKKILIEDGWEPGTWHTSLRSRDTLQGWHFTETQRGYVTCPRSHNQDLQVPGFE